MRKITTEIDGLEKDREITKNDVTLLKAENAELRVKLEELTQYSKKNNLIIHGIPSVKGENLREIVERIDQNVEVEIQKYHIAAIHRLPSKRNKEAVPIIVKFNDNDVKKEMLINTKKVKPKTSDIGFGVSNPIYIDEHLTKETLSLWLAAKQMKKNGLIFSASCREGKVKIKRSESRYPMRVVSMKQLQCFKTEDGKTGLPEEAGYIITAENNSGVKRTMEIRSPENNAANQNGTQQKSKIMRSQDPASTKSTSQSTLDRFRIHGDDQYK